MPPLRPDLTLARREAEREMALAQQRGERIPNWSFEDHVKGECSFAAYTSQRDQFPDIIYVGGYTDAVRVFGLTTNPRGRRKARRG